MSSDIKKGDNQKIATYENIVEDIKRISNELKIQPYEVNKTAYSKYGVFTENNLKKCGGLTNIIKDAFGHLDEKDLVAIRGTASRKAYIDKLEKALGDRNYFTDRVSEAIKDALKQNPIQISAPRKVQLVKKGKQERWNVCAISDTHFGINIDSDEVEGNDYNWTIAARRLSKVIKTLAEYKIHHRDECLGVVLNIGGDIISNHLRPDDYGIDLLSYQIIGAARYIISSIDYLLNYYPKVKVVTTPGNHDRIINHTKGKDRALKQKYDSYNTIMFEAVQQAFRNNSNVEFNIPKTPYATYKLFKWNYLLTHGDTYISSGSPSKSINMSNIISQIDSINASRNAEDRYHVVIMGHVHVAVQMLLNNDVDLIINPSLSGTDPFAQSIGISRTRCGQTIWEVTSEYSTGDKRVVICSDADNDSHYDSIIKPYDYSLRLK